MKIESIGFNFIAGEIERESFQQTLSEGATTRHLLEFLERHAHPCMRKVRPILPPNAVDQLRLWERELSPLRCTPASLVEFSSWAGGENVRRADIFAKCADDSGALVWKGSKSVIVTRERLPIVIQKAKAEFLGDGLTVVEDADSADSALDQERKYIENVETARRAWNLPPPKADDDER